MRLISLALALVSVAAAASPEYRARRDALTKAIPHAVPVLFGGIPKGADIAEVISVEPRIYIPEENIGIRIEDMIMVTGEGAKVLTAALPREPAEIERALAK
jgi:hypothetical protein